MSSRKIPSLRRSVYKLEESHVGCIAVSVHEVSVLISLIFNALISCISCLPNLINYIDTLAKRGTFLYHKINNGKTAPSDTKNFTLRAPRKII